MAKLNKWCDCTDKTVNGHLLRILEADSSKIDTGIAEVAKTVPSHYASNALIAAVMKQLGKPKASAFIKNKLPKSKNIRSGDLGEILAASYVAEFTNFTTSINRLRWKDHRDMAMRGDDIIAIQEDTSPEKIKFLKGEVKSSASLSTPTVEKARKALKKDRSRPSPHSLAFLADRLYEKGNNKLAMLIHKTLLHKGVKLSQVSHLLFTFSGNDPTTILQNDLISYTGSVDQFAVGIHVTKHQSFIKAVYDKVSSGA